MVIWLVLCYGWVTTAALFLYVILDESSYIESACRKNEMMAQRCNDCSVLGSHYDRWTIPVAVTETRWSTWNVLPSMYGRLDSKRQNGISFSYPVRLTSHTALQSTCTQIYPNVKCRIHLRTLCRDANHYDLGVIITQFGPSLRHYAQGVHNYEICCRLNSSNVHEDVWFPANSKSSFSSFFMFDYTSTCTSMHFRTVDSH